MNRTLTRAILMTTALMWCAAGPVAADSWNERTILQFNAPIIVPGATLQPGAYIFKLAKSPVNRDIVQIFTKDESEMIAQIFAVPTKRQDPNGDIVLKFNPTEPGTPPALKAFFYPGSRYGHEFVYPEAQAKEIANRTRTVVLSMNTDGMESGTLRVVDASGAPRPWTPDASTEQEWRQWRGSARAEVHDDRTPGTEPDSRAVVVQTRQSTTRVKVDDLEEHPDQYVGRTITVDAEVQDVFGPRVFSIDEPNWGDLDGEILVTMPTDLAALVKENDRVSVTGTLKRYLEADLQRELSWFEPGTVLNLSLRKKPVLVASRIVGGNDNMVLSIRTVQQSDNTTVGTSGRNEESAPAANRASAGTIPDISSLGAITGYDDVGRHVEVRQVKVTALAGENGFWVKGTNPSNILVLPAAGAQRRVTPGEPVSIEGIVLQMPRGRRGTLTAPGRTVQDVYVYATSIGS